MSNLTDFFPSGGGGGLTPKFEEFNASGTFTPSQALIDAGGYIEVFLVAGGGGGENDNYASTGGAGGEVIIKKMYLSSVNSCNVTIGSGGNKGASGSNGGNSSFLGSSAGGIDVTSLGGSGGNTSFNINKVSSLSPSWGADLTDGSRGFTAGNGVFGFGAGGGWSYGGGSGQVLNNSGKGGVSGYNDASSSNGSSGYCLIKWYE
jgi:hypothetical protein